MKVFIYIFIFIFLVSCTTKKETVKVNMDLKKTKEMIQIQKEAETITIPVEEIVAISMKDEMQSNYKEKPAMSSSKTTKTDENKKEKFLSKIIYEDSDYGNINYVLEDTMIVGKTTAINVTISENVDQATIIEEIETFEENNVKTIRIRISPIMRARLIDPSEENFKIVSLTPEEQIVENDQITRWEWGVTPLKKGNHKLKLTVDILQDDNCKNVEVHEDFIYVYSDKGVLESVFEFMGKNWQWFLSTLIIPLTIWLYRKRKKSKD